VRLRLDAGSSCRLVRGPLDRLDHGSPGAARVAVARARLDRRDIPPRVADLARELGLSERHLGRSFRSLLGISTKRYLRLIRFEHALRLAHERAHPDWAQHAVECGYFDQTHMIRDFREFAGLTPSRWQDRRSFHPWLVVESTENQAQLSAPDRPTVLA